jgi:hypothetical protein
MRTNEHHESVRPTTPTSDNLHVASDHGNEGPLGLVPEGGASDIVAPVGADVGVGCRKGVISSADLLARSRARANSGAPLWGLHVRAGTVTLLIGETSAGKTVFLHNFGFHMASGRDFLGIAPPRDLRVFHVDFESYDAIYEDHLPAIGTIEG